MSMKVAIKLAVPRVVEILIDEIKRLNCEKDYLLIDCQGNSLYFHKIILQNVSPKFDYLNKFCGDFVNGCEQMRLQSFNCDGLKSLYDLIYNGSSMADDCYALNLIEQLELLQLPLITESFNNNGNKQLKYSSSSSISPPISYNQSTDKQLALVPDNVEDNFFMNFDSIDSTDSVGLVNQVNLVGQGENNNQIEKVTSYGQWIEAIEPCKQIEENKSTSVQPVQVNSMNIVRKRVRKRARKRRPWYKKAKRTKLSCAFNFDLTKKENTCPKFCWRKCDCSQECSRMRRKCFHVTIDSNY